MYDILNIGILFIFMKGLYFMNLEEANKFIKISKEEETSLKTYKGFYHTVINLLCDMEPTAYDALSKAGWKMIESKEEIEEAINNFVNIYSAMYKNSRGSKGLSSLVRGTSNKQINRISNKTLSFLSTSRSEDVAKTFTQYGDDALVRIGLKEGVPYIDMEPYKSEESRDEEEVLISPFCNVSRKELVSKWEGYTYYRMGLSKPELQEIESDELSSLRKSVIDGFINNLEDMKEYLRLTDMIEASTLRYESYKGDRDSQREILETKAKKQEEADALYSKIRKFKENTRSLLEGLCRQREIEIDEAYKVIDEDEKRLQEERKRKVEMQIRHSHFYDLNKSIRCNIRKFKKTRY